MLLFLKLLALVPALGLDTLATSVALGARRVDGALRIAAAFMLAEALLPLVGLALGSVVGKALGEWASLAGGAALIGVAIWAIREDPDDDDDADDDDEGDRPPRPGLRGWPLVVAALGVGMDELAVGFSIGLVGVPVALTVSLIAAQALGVTFLGLWLGRRMAHGLGEWAERLSAAVLGLLGLYIIVEAVLRLLVR